MLKNIVIIIKVLLVLSFYGCSISAKKRDVDILYDKAKYWTYLELSFLHEKGYNIFGENYYNIIECDLEIDSLTSLLDTTIVYFHFTHLGNSIKTIPEYCIDREITSWEKPFAITFTNNKYVSIISHFDRKSLGGDTIIIHPCLTNQDNIFEKQAIEYIDSINPTHINTKWVIDYYKLHKK